MPTSFTSEDCRDAILALDWEPIWSLEHRSPTFVSEEDVHGPHDPHSLGHALYAFSSLCPLYDSEDQEPSCRWGNVPAADILNLKHNEGDVLDMDFKVAFPGEISNTHPMSCPHF